MYLHAHGPGLIQTKKKISEIENIKGLRIKGTGINAKIVQAYGGVPVSMPMGETYDPLQKGLASKIKKARGPLNLTLETGPDILAELGRDKGRTLLVGFAAETDDLLANARAKLEAKNLDFVVANDVSAPGVGFGAERNAVRRGGRVAVTLRPPACPLAVAVPRRLTRPEARPARPRARNASCANTP